MREMFFFEHGWNRLRRHASRLLLSLAVALPLTSYGEEQATEAVPGFLSAIDSPRDYVAEKFVGLATGIDHFFGDERNYQETNKSVIQMNLTRVIGYGGARNFVLSGRAKVDLPNTEKRLRVVVETNPDKNVTGEATQGKPSPLDKVAAPESYAVAARFERARESVWHYSTDAGLKFQSGLTPFARIRGSYSLPMDQWRLKVAESVFWFNTIGVGESTQLDLERPLSEPVLFRATSNASWLLDEHNFDLRQDFSIYHTLSERSALLYQVAVIGVSEPQVQATEYVALFLYRYRLHRSWMFFEVSPQLHFPKVKNFQLSPQLNLRLEMLFDESK